MLGRLGDPETDLTGPLLLLASRASSYLTGQVLYVDGGWSAWYPTPTTDPPPPPLVLDLHTRRPPP